MPEKYDLGYLWNPEEVEVPEFYQPSEEELAAQRLAALVHDTYEQRESKKRQRRDARREMLNTPVEVQSTWGSSTAPVFNVEIPRVESTVGKELGTAAAYAAAPALFSPAALNFAGNMAVGLPAFEVADRLPTLIGQPRATQQAGNLLEAGFRAAVPEGKLWQNFEDRVAPYVNQAGQVIGGLPVGAGAEMLTRGAAQGIMNKMARNAARKAVSNSGYMDGLAEMMAGDQPMNLADYTPEQIAQAQAQMQADAPVIRDALAGNRATPTIEQTLLHQPVMEAALPNGYQIARYPGGYMLKSLMSGNPLEKQIGKNGTVNVNNIKALIGKGSKVEQMVVDKVLASEQFAGKKAIDYNDFRKAVQDELITYQRTPDTRWENYGLNRIGISTPDEPASMAEAEAIGDAIHRYARENGFEWTYDNANRGIWLNRETGERLLPSEIRDRSVSLSAPQLNTYTFSSSRIPNGSAKHYDSNTLGHSRTYTTADEPDVLHVMESQSDWAQQRRGNILVVPINEASANEHKLFLEQQIRKLEQEGYPESDIAPFREELQKHLDRWKATYDSNSVQEQSNYLINNFTSRQIQENLRYAAEKGQKKMRYPTRETAAKIEGYPEWEAYFDAEGNDITKSGKQLYEWSKEDQEALARLEKELAPIEEIRNKLDLEWQGIDTDLDPRLKDLVSIEYDEVMLYSAPDFDDEAIVKFAESLNSKKVAYEKKYGVRPDVEELHNIVVESNDIHQQIAHLEEKQTKLLPGITKKKVYSHEDILKKYTEFPKQYKKLFKGSDVRVATDPKGNTWYEVDVPENYLQQEWAYKYGGLIERLQKHYGDGGKILDAINRAKVYAKGGRKYDRNSKTDAGDLYYDIVRQRRNSAFNALLRSGETPENAARLAPMITTQQTMEGGWRLNRKDNNYGGMRAKGKTIAYDSEDAFQDAYLKMLDSKWGEGRPSEYNWRSAQNLDDWARILNREDLGLHTQEDWTNYNKGRNGNDFVYLYAPEWENNNKPYREHLRKTEDLTKMYLDMLDRDEPYDKLVPMPHYELPEAVVTPDMQGKAKPVRMYNALIPSSVRSLINSREDGGLLADYRSGGKIHIKPENRGKFTALKKRTGHSASWFKAHGTPAQKKMAVFALNSRKWKHADGGLVDRLNAHTGGDAAKMLDLIQKARKG